MAYHPLANDTGQTPEQRREEADRILKILSDSTQPEELTEKEMSFLDAMDEGGPVSPKQLFWLRDIKSRYLE